MELERTVIYIADCNISHSFKSLRINFTQSKFLCSVAAAVIPNAFEKISPFICLSIYLFASLFFLHKTN